MIFLFASSIQIVIATCRNQRVAAVAAAAATAALEAHAHDHMIAIAAVHCQNPRIVIHDPVHQKIMAAPVAHQTEMKAWMIKMGTLTSATLLLS